MTIRGRKNDLDNITSFCYAEIQPITGKEVTQTARCLIQEKEESFDPLEVPYRARCAHVRIELDVAYHARVTSSK